MSTKGQFVLGFCAGVAGSFMVLQSITERRLIGFQSRPDSATDLASKYDMKYEILLYRLMWEKKGKDGGMEEEEAWKREARNAWNSAISSAVGVVGFVSSGASSGIKTSKDKFNSIIGSEDK